MFFSSHLFLYYILSIFFRDGQNSQGLLKVAQNDKKKPQNLSVAQTSLLSWNGGPSYCCY